MTLFETDFVTLFDYLTGEIPGSIFASTCKNPPVSVPVIAFARMDFAGLVIVFSFLGNAADIV